jgi:hypothetical protein
MNLRSPIENENADVVMPAWIAGIQVRKDAPETSVSIWIPALHAGMTQSRELASSAEAPPPVIFKGVIHDLALAPDNENRGISLRMVLPRIVIPAQAGIQVWSPPN